MFLEENIGAAVEEVWQLAMTMAILKHIAGMVRQDLNTVSGSEEQEGENMHTDESNIDVKEYQASTEEIIAEQEEEILTLIHHQTQIYSDISENQEDQMVPIVETWKTDLLANKEVEPPFITSMVPHQLPSVDTPVQLSEWPVSKIAHVISTNVSEDVKTVSDSKDQEDDKQTNESHKPSHIDKKEVINDGSLSSYKEKIEPNLPSVASHSLPFKNTSIAHEEIQFNASMVQPSTEEKVEHDDQALTMVHYVLEYQEDTMIPIVATQTTELLEKEKVEQTLITSMVAHHLPPVDSPGKLSELPFSLITHVILTNGNEALQNTSMKVHQVKNKEQNFVKGSTKECINDRSIISSDKEKTNYDKSEIVTNSFTCQTPDNYFQESFAVIEEVDIFNQMIDEKHILEAETCFIPSMCSYQTQTHIENSEYQVSMTVSGTIETEEMIADPGIAISLVSHQVLFEDKDVNKCIPEDWNTNVDELRKVANFDSIDMNEIPSCNSMVAHQLPFVETSMEFSEYLVSTATFGSLSLKEEDIIQDCGFESNPGLIDTKLSLQAAIEDQIGKIMIIEELTENNLETDPLMTSPIAEENDLDARESVNNEIIDVNQIPMTSSMIAHQLPFVETPMEFSEFLVSTATFGLLSIKEEHSTADRGFESDPKMIYSKWFNQVAVENQSGENLITEELKENNLNSSKPFEYERVQVISTDPHGCFYFKDCSCLENNNVKQIILNQRERFSFDMMDSEINCINMDPDRIPVYDVSIGYEVFDPTELQEEDSECAYPVAHRGISKELDYSLCSEDHIGAHPTTDKNKKNVEDNAKILTLVVHKPYTSSIEEHESEHIPEILNNKEIEKEYATIAKEKTNIVQDPESVNYFLPEIIYEIQYIDSPLEDTTHITSLVSHQLPFLAIIDQFEYADCITSMATHQEMPTIYENEEEEYFDNTECFQSKDKNTGSNDTCKCDNMIGENNLNDDFIEYHKLVENINSCYTNGSETIENKNGMFESMDDVSSNLLNKSHMNREEDEEIFEDYNEFINAEQGTYNETVIKAYDSKLTRLQELQRIVKDEIGEFNDKRNNDSIIKENYFESTKTHTISNDKDIECISKHQELNDEFEKESLKESVSDEESISSTTESIDSVIFTPYAKFGNEQNNNKVAFGSTDTSELNNSADNRIETSFAIENNNPIIITEKHLERQDLDTEHESTVADMEYKIAQKFESTIIQQDDNKENESGPSLELNNRSEERKNKNSFNDGQMDSRKMTRDSLNIGKKMRESKINNSFSQDISEESKCMKNSTNNVKKHSSILPSLNENVKRQTYKIRFKVKLNPESSKSSALQCLLGYFGGEKLY